MKRTVASLMFVGLLTAGAAAFAQDQSAAQPPPPMPTNTQSSTTTTTTSSTNMPSKHEVMKDCIAREQADNTSMSKSDAKKACHDAMKAQKDTQQNAGSQPQ
jgi:ABC-type glycerol-3-phosphate transport system substrate-binding protein